MRSIMLNGKLNAANLTKSLIEKNIYHTVHPLKAPASKSEVGFSYRISVNNEDYEHIEGYGVGELEILNIRGIECYLDTKLNQLRVKDNPEIFFDYEKDDYPAAFRALPGFIPDEIEEKLIEAAKQHGLNSEPDHEVGDLQKIIRECFGVMTNQQMNEVLEELDMEV